VELALGVFVGVIAPAPLPQVLPGLPATA
jgi:hypothetical protein